MQVWMVSKTHISNNFENVGEISEFNATVRVKSNKNRSRAVFLTSTKTVDVFVTDDFSFSRLLFLES